MNLILVRDEMYEEKFGKVGDINWMFLIWSDFEAGFGLRVNRFVWCGEFDVNSCERGLNVSWEVRNSINLSMELEFFL